MRNSAKHAIRLSEIRVRLNDIGGLAADAVTDEIRSEGDALGTEYRTLESQYRAALTAEGDEERAASAAFGNADPEAREFRDLRGRTRLGAYITAAMEMRSVDGAEAELNSHLGIGASRFPLAMLAPSEPEVRATTDAENAVRPGRWLDRLFAESSAMRIGITMESVEPGVAAYPVTTAGATGAQRGRSENAAAAGWTVGVTEIKPTRNAVQAIFSIEDAARMPGLEDALVRGLPHGDRRCR